MKSFYGLRLMRLFYTATAWVVAIFSVIGAGVVFIEPILAEEPMQTVRALSILVLGGMAALTLYVFAQLIELLIEQQKMVIQQQKYNEQLLERVNRIGAMVERLQPPSAREDIQVSIEERKRNLRKS